MAARALAAGVNLAWDPVTSSSLAGYMVYYGPAAGSYPNKIDVGNTTTYAVTGLVEGSTYHFAVTAYDAAHTESGYSNDAGTTVPYSAPVAQFTGSPTSGTFPLTVNFSNTSTGSITSQAWNFGDGGTSTAANPSHVYAAAGTYTVSLTVTGPGGSNTQTRTNYVTVSAPAAPVAQFTGSPTSGTAPLTANFTNTSTGTISSYAWTFGDGGTSTAANPSHVYAAAGTYTVALTVTGPGGTDTQTRSNYVRAGTAPVGQFTGAPTKGKAPQTVAFTSTSTGSITNYAWDFGDGTTSAVANPNKLYSTSGVYTVALTVTGPGGSNTKTQTNYVKVTPGAKFSASSTSGMAPLTVNFADESMGGGVTAYAWDFGDGTISTLANPGKVYSVPGVYTVTLTVTGVAGSDAQTISDYVSVTSPPDVTFLGIPLGKTNFDADLKTDILFKATAGGGDWIVFMNGASVVNSFPAPAAAPGWVLAGSGDFNGDGHADMLWANTADATQYWIFLLNGNSIIGGGPVSVAAGYLPTQIGDFDGDGKSDILWENSSGGRIFFMNGATVVDSQPAPAAAPGWVITGIGDFNGDGKADILWNNTANPTQYQIYLLNGATIVGSGGFTVASGYIPTQIADFDGDGKADILWENGTAGRWIFFMNGASVTNGLPAPAAAPGWTVVGSGDFNQDRKADLLWQNSADPTQFWIYLLDGTSVIGGGGFVVAPGYSPLVH
jgi:PKD repeat protein